VLVSDEFFHGYALNAVDGKNRLSIPSDYRLVIQARSGCKDIRLAPSRTAPCLIGYDRTHFARMKADHDARFAGEVSRARDADAISIFGAVTPLTIDDAGRVVLPPILRKLRGIGSHVWFIAGGDFFEIWDPWEFLAQPGSDPFMVETLKCEMEAKNVPLAPPAAGAAA